MKARDIECNPRGPGWRIVLRACEWESESDGEVVMKGGGIKYGEISGTTCIVLHIEPFRSVSVPLL